MNPSHSELGIVGASRRRRLERERNASRLRFIEVLLAEVAEQAEPELGPGGRPMGEAALSAWRRRRVSDYLALPPSARAWRTWRSWCRVQRALVPVAAALLWPVLVLPLRMAGLASDDATLWGIVAFMALAPVALVAPPARCGRFVDLPERTAPTWSGTRQAARLRRAGVLVAVAIGVALIALIAVRPASPGGADDRPAQLTSADRLVVEQTVARVCGTAVPVRVRPLVGDRYAATLPNGSTAVVEVVFTGRRLTGAGAGFGRVVGAPPAC